VAKAQEEREEIKEIIAHLRRLTTEMTQLRNENFYGRNNQGYNQNHNQRYSQNYNPNYNQNHN